MAKVASVTNLQCLLRNDRLDCYYIQIRLALRCSRDSVVKLARPTMFLVVTIYYLLFRSIDRSREGGREGEREGGREGGMEGGRERGREGGRESCCKMLTSTGGL